jgi:putative ABC transport system permease protein
MLQRILRDSRDAIRGLRRTPGFTSATMLVLGLGIGVNAAVFTVANATLFKGFSGVAEQERLVYVTTGRDCCLSYQDLVDWRADSRTLEGLAAVADQRVSLDAGAGLETVTASEVTFELFAILRARPALGRGFAAADDTPGAAPVAILSDAFWRSRFAADPSVLGQIVRVNGAPTAVIGVMPPGFVFPQRQDLWMPMGPRVSGQPRNARGLWFAVGRLQDGVTMHQVRADLETTGARLALAYPDTNRGVRPTVQTFREFFVGPNAVAIYGALSGGVAVLLVIACANIVTLLLVRAANRTREAALRLAIGATRASVARVQLFETVVLSLCSGVFGWLIAEGLIRGYAAVAVPPTQPWASQLFDYTVDLRVFAYLLGVSLASGIATGLIPALRASGLDVQAALRDGGRGSIGSRQRHRTTRGIVVTQVALAVALLAAAGVLARSFWIVHTRALGYDPSRLVVALASLPPARYPDAASQFQFLDRLASAVRAIRGVQQVAFVDGLPGQGGARAVLEIEGRPSIEVNDRVEVRQVSISPTYFETLGANIAAGRAFDDRDTVSTPPTTIVSQRLAAFLSRTEDVLGRRIRVASATTPGPWLTIVGVAPDIRQGDRTRTDIEPVLYRPLRQRSARGAWIVARASDAAQPLVAPLRREIQRADPELPIWLGPFTLEQWHAGTYWRRGLNGGLFVLFGALALVLASSGLFAVMSAAVAHRRQELSVRMAIGASAMDVVWLAVRQGLTPAAIGLALGLVVALASNRWLSGELVGIAPWDPLTFAAVAALVTLSALAGCIVPALRAARVDPADAMRVE